MEKQWIDISQPFSKKIGTWPGDTPFQFELTYSKEETGSVNIGRFTTSVHTGTHADAPFHFDSDAPTIEQLDINIYIGRAKVVDVIGLDLIGREELEAFELAGVERLLLKTAKRVNEEQFPTKIPVLKENIGAFLQEKGIFLIGVDHPSVDALDDKELPAHHALYLHGVHILENLLLQDVVPGDYEMIALPLKIQGADGSPVRAVIRAI
ncbi:arylformamidase [Psychrobacillus lasiicapitis]|uniref:Kynurenine formamidase n=1 Tax=Psychrobacillus lasiicapitis TaxID=1636719 RepID=A0A544T1X5_9BACI|nr:arylformamidase [Psychrobacillus lasiicapitis]TQR11456.1 arylformamidase [Psychrobacillus lasiicapitis]GGA40374.1 kynurenine formamidase [Psychrobacillus lasiicapitis]